jgi:hypothetical protein
MFKKFLLTLIIVLLLIALSVRLFGGSSKVDDQALDQQTAPTATLLSRVPANQPQTKLWFTPTPLVLKPNGTLETEVFLEANENKVTGVHYEIAYDPNVFAFVSLEPVDLLGGKKVTVNSVDRKTGIITFDAVINQATTPPIVGGDETIEIILRPIADPSQSQITFLPGTKITAEGIEGNALVAVTNAKVQ